MDDNKVFYVGKGTGRRALSHEEEVKIMLETARNEESLGLGQKRETIARILAAGRNPIAVVVGRYASATEAFAVESTLIHFMYGHENLANIASGHGSKFIRTRDAMSVIQSCGKIERPIMGIDIPERTGMRDNSFRDANLERLHEDGAFEYLQELKSALDKENFFYRDFITREDRKFDPGRANGYLAAIVTVGDLDLIVQFTSKMKIGIVLAFTDATLSKAGKKSQQRLLTFLGVARFEPKKNHTYAWVEGKEKKYDDIDDLILRLKIFRSVLTGK